jgi:hypothetical protein
MLSGLVVPAPIGLVFAVGAKQPLIAFAIFTGSGYFFALAVLVFAFLPALWLLSWIAPVKRWHTIVIGGLIALPVFVLWDYTSWTSSGVDSGPPDCTYAQWVAKNWLTWEPLCTLAIGMISGAAYHYLATRKKGP